MEVERYLERIAYHGTRAPTLETLVALHRAHLLAVPFENLDIHFRTRIEPIEELLFDKIVRRGRGGFCYELNGLFASLLRVLGFRVDMLSARVAGVDGSFGPEFDHLALLVHLQSPWIADVGFGDSFRVPMRLKNGFEQRDESGSYRLTHNGDWLLLKEEGGGWVEQYRFTLRPRALSDFEPMCDYHQTSPESPFTRKRLCTLATNDGRVTISDLRIIATSGGARSERLLGSEEEWQSAMREHFGFAVGPAGSSRD